MRYTLWLYLVFATAVAVALFFGTNGATVAVFWPPMRLDLSLNLALLVILVVFVLAHLTWQSVKALLHLPTQARHWRLAQKERAMHHAFLMSQSYFFAGRFTRGKKAAQNAIGLAKELSTHLDKSVDAWRVLALSQFIAARCCHELSDRVGRDTYLAAMQNVAIEHTDTQLKDATLMQAARWALDDDSPGTAMELLSALTPGSARRTSTLKIRLRASQLAGRIDKAFETAQLLVKHRAFSASASAALLRGLAIQALRQAPDLEQLAVAWGKLSATQQSQTDVVAVAVARVGDLSGEAAQARQWLEAAWETLMRQMAQGDAPMGGVDHVVEALSAHLSDLDGIWLARIEKAHQQYPNSPSLAFLAGCACYQRSLWGKSEALLQAALPRLQGTRFEREGWRLLAELSDKKGLVEEANRYFRQAARVHQ